MPQAALARSAVTGEDGDYEIARLPAGDYEVSAFLPGFRADPTAARVAGAETVVDFTLIIAPRAETVTVTRSEQSLDDVANTVAVLGARGARLHRAEGVERSSSSNGPDDRIRRQRDEIARLRAELKRGERAGARRRRPAPSAPPRSAR